MKKEHSLKIYTLIVIIFVISIVVLGVSLSYSYFNVNVEGSKNIPANQTPQFNVTTTLDSVNTINAAQLALINSENYENEAEKVSFAVTNSSTSEVKAKYTINLEEMTISKNLASKYFKWALVINGESDSKQIFSGDFADANIAVEGNSDTTTVGNLSKVLINDENAIVLDIGKTDSLVFYIWLENDDTVDQLYLTNGTFSGKLSMSAVPTR